MNDMNEASLFAWATQVLSACSMSHKEICEVVGANDPEILRRHIELHLEWLEERLADQRRSLARVQRVLFGQIPLDDAALVMPSPGKVRTVIA